MTVVLELEHVERSIYVSWSGDLAVDRFSKGFESVSSVVEIGKRFADCLGLTERQQVGFLIIYSYIYNPRGGEWSSEK